LEFETALLKARKGTIDFTKQLTEAEGAALELVAVQKQVGAAARGEGGAGGNPFIRFVDGAADLARVTGIGLFIGNIFRLQGAIEESITAATELSRKLAEIDTIQTDNALSTGQWAKELRNLANTFGIDTIDQAEAAYQALSNQVAQGAEAVTFLGAANRLAVTGLTDASSAVKLLSSAINAFRLPVGDAETLSAKFFKTVELGRVRIEELADTFGRVAVPANQLGISFEEVNAAIATLSIQGIKADEAITLLRNIIQKLIRPGKELKATLAEMGFATGQAAIEALGFGGVLGALEEKVGGNVEQVGELFQRIRAITGVLGFAGESAKVYAANLDKISKSNVNEFAEDTNKILESSGQQLKLASQQAKNFFEEAIGTPAIDAFSKFIKSAGGAREILEQLVSGLTVLGGAAVTGLVISKMLAFNKALEAVSFTARAAAASNALLSLSVTQLIGITAVGLASAFVAYEQSVARALRAIEQVAGASNKAILAGIEAATQQAEVQADAITKLGEASRRDVQLGFASQQAALEKLSRSAKIEAAVVKAEFKAVNREITKSVKRLIKEQDNLFNQAKKRAEAAGKEIGAALESIDLESLNIDFNVAGLGLQIQFVEDQITRSRERANKAAEEGDVERFKAETKRVNTLSKKRLEAEVKLSQQELKLNEKVIALEDKLREATGTKARDRIQRNLRQLRERISIIKSGTKAQLDGLKELQAAQNKVEDATTNTAIRDAEKELKKVEERQARINTGVERERKLRQGLNSEQLTQADTLQNILDINAERQAQAEKRRSDLENTRQLLALVSEEAKTFNETTALGADNAKEVNEEIRKQQERFAEIIRLQQKLGLDGNAIIQKRAIGLQARGQIALDKLRVESNRKQFNAVKKEADFRARETAKGKIADRERVNALGKALRELEKQLGEVTGARIADGTADVQKIGAAGREALGVSPTFSRLRQSGDLGGRFDALSGFTGDILDVSSRKLLRELDIPKVSLAFVELEGRIAALRRAIDTVTTLDLDTTTNPADLAANRTERAKALAEVARLNKQVTGNINEFLEVIRLLRNPNFSVGADPVASSRAFEQTLLDTLASIRLGTAGVAGLSGSVEEARAGVLRAIQLEQASLARKGIVLTKKQLTETEKFLKKITDFPTAIEVLGEVLARQEEQEKNKLKAPGIEDIPGLSKVFTNGGLTVRQQIEQGFTTGAKKLAAAGTELGKNQAKGVRDQNKADADARKAAIAKAKADREAALKAEQAEKAKGEFFVDREGRFIARGGGQGIGSNDFDQRGFGRLAARGGGQGVGSNDFDQRAFGRLVSTTQRVNTPDSKVPTSGQGAAEAALAKRLAGRGRTSSFSLSDVKTGKTPEEVLAAEHAARDFVEAGNKWAVVSEAYFKALADHALLLADPANVGTKADAAQFNIVEKTGQEFAKVVIANREFLERQSASKARAKVGITTGPPEDKRRPNLPGAGGAFPEAVSEARRILERNLEALTAVVERELAKPTPDAARLGLALDTIADRVARLDKLNKQELDAKTKIENGATAAATVATAATAAIAPAIAAAEANRLALEANTKATLGCCASNTPQNRVFGNSTQTPYTERLGFNAIRPISRGGPGTTVNNTTNNTNSNNTTVKMTVTGPNPEQTAKLAAMKIKRQKRIAGFRAARGNN
jgi:TP901 family phage tail tape measure protein